MRAMKAVKAVKAESAVKAVKAVKAKKPMKAAFKGPAVLLVAAALLAGCGERQTQVEEQPGEQQRTVSTEPVTLSILNWNGMSEEEFQRYFVNPVSKKHPHITLQLVKKESGSPADAISKHMLGGNVPDLIYVSNKDINHFLQANLVRTLDDLVRKHAMDLNRFDGPAIQSLQNRTSTGGLLSVPWAQNVAGLFYNMDIFDRFGVAYPKSLMTWEEASQLSRSLTRMESGVQYFGLNLSSLSQFAQSQSVSYVSRDGKALVDTPQWRRILEFYKAHYDIPGYRDSKGTFFGTKTVAMQPDWVSTVLTNASKNEDVRWDVTGLPNFRELLGTGREVDAHTLAIRSGSPHADQAFQVIQTVTSEEVQTEMSRYGRISVLDNSRITSDFGKELPYFAGKRWADMFQVTPGKLRDNNTPYDSIVLDQINPMAEKIRVNNADINTLLREAQEKAEQLLQAEMKG